MATTTLSIKRLSPLAVIPAFQSGGAAGLDMHAAIAVHVVSEAGQIAMISIGIAIELPPGHGDPVRARSGLARTTGITLTINVD